MGFRDLFKVRRPGHGDAFQKKAEAASKFKNDFAKKNSTANSSGKKAV